MAAENNQKLDSSLNLAMDITQSDREKSLELGTGFEPEEQLWRVIVKYIGDLAEIETLVQMMPISGNIWLVSPQINLKMDKGAQQLHFYQSSLLWELDVDKALLGI